MRGGPSWATDIRCVAGRGLAGTNAPRWSAAHFFAAFSPCPSVSISKHGVQSSQARVTTLTEPDRGSSYTGSCSSAVICNPGGTNHGETRRVGAGVHGVDIDHAFDRAGEGNQACPGEADFGGVRTADVRQLL